MQRPECEAFVRDVLVPARALLDCVALAVALSLVEPSLSIRDQRDAFGGFNARSRELLSRGLDHAGGFVLRVVNT